MPFIRRRPLLRAAAVGGGAYYMGQRHAQMQEQAASQYQPAESQQAAPAAAPIEGVSSDSIQKLQELGTLHEQGILTDEEFAQQKEKLLAG